jgi:polar amino acid transport system substrate-binding protein
MKKYILLTIITLLYGCSDHTDDNVIKFATSAEYPPFEFQQLGELKGFDIDLAKLIAKEIGKEAVFENIQFSSVLPALEHGQVDAAISTITITKERAKNFDFSIPYYFDQMVTVFNTKTPILAQADLAGKKIACQLGTVMEIWLKNNAPGTEVITMNSNNQAIEALKAGHIDAVLIDAAQGAIFSQKNPGLSCAVIAQSEDGYGVAFKKGSNLKSPVDQAIKNLQAKGEIKKLQDKWIEKWKN